MVKVMRDLIMSVAIYLTIVFLWTSLAQAGTLVGKVKARGVRSPQGVVVYMDPKCKGNGFVPAAGKQTVLDQENMLFVPRILPVEVGTTVDFINSDTVPHTAFTPSPMGDRFNTGLMVNGQDRTHTFTRPGVVPFLCALHPEMEAYVVVLESPYFAVTNEKGSFVIPNVPPGTHRFVTWHKKLKAKTIKVEVPAQGTVEVAFKLRR